MTREHCPGSKIEGLTVPSEVGLGEGQPPWETVWRFFKKWHEEGGPWVAQLVKRLTCAPVMSSQFPGSSPAWGSALPARGLEPASDSVSPSLSAPPPLAVCLSLNNKH